MAWPAYCALRDRVGADHLQVQHAQGDSRAAFTPFLFPDVVGRAYTPERSERVFTSQHGGKTRGFLEWDGVSSEIRMNLRMVGADDVGEWPAWRCPLELPPAERYDIVIAPRSSEERKDYDEWGTVARILAMNGFKVATVDAFGPPLPETADLVGIGLAKTFSIIARALAVGANDSGIFHVGNMIGVSTVGAFTGATSIRKNFDPEFYRRGSVLLSPDPEDLARALMEAASSD